MNVKWGENTWEQIRQAAREDAIAVIPCGSVEQHGPMLPLDTDVRIAQKKSEQGASLAWHRHGVRCAVLPTLPFGLAAHHLDFAGTISLEPETYITVLSEIMRSIIRAGFRRIALISGHGGNNAGIELATRKVRNEFRDTHALWIATFKGHQDPEFARRSRELLEGRASEGQPGIHASRWETSETLADRPELVVRERMQRPELELGSVPEWSWLTHELSTTGAFGDPSLADAELGQATWDAWAECVALFLKRLSEAPCEAPPDTTNPH